MKISKCFPLLVSFACVIGLVACDDDSDNLVELSQPDVAQTLKSYNALGFEWSAVPNTIQYGYKLYDPDEVVIEAGVTKDTYVSFSNLKPSTTYTLRVWAFAGLDTDYFTSPAAELVATTGRLVYLEQPANLTVTGDKGAYTVTWDAVADAESYVYTVFSGADVVKTGTIDASNNSFTLTGCGRDKDCRITLKAVSSLDGYFDSDEAETYFSYVSGPGDISWSAAGTYTSYIYNKNWSATMNAYVDGSYSVESFYGADGYDLVFTVDSSNYLVMQCGQLDDSGQFWLIPTGNDAIGDLYSYVWSGYAMFSGDSAGGNMFFLNYDWDWNYGYDMFAW